VPPNTTYRQTKRLSRAIAYPQKPLYKAVSAPLRRRERAAFTHGHCIKDGIFIDPACGTGGFLVYLMQDAVRKINERYLKREITKPNRDDAVMRLKRSVFYGSDANDGVAASAKMNMIVAGDGHTNIQHENSLSKHASNWSVARPDCTLILTNPPFGTSECGALSSDDMEQFSVRTSKGQHLFLQKMIACTLPGGEICTVIDEGVLNTDSGAALRKHMLRACRLKAVVSLPAETFKPNKINVKASLLYMEKRDAQDGFDDIYDVTAVKISSLGYQGSGDKIRGFDFDRLVREIGTDALVQDGKIRSGYFWEAYDVSSRDIYADLACRLDYKYWKTTTRDSIKSLADAGNLTLDALNTIPTSRGKSPSPDDYVDDTDGYAVVIKAGNIGKSGKLSLDGADWIEKAVYDAYAEMSQSGGKEAYVIRKNDVLLASTGDGTLGKCCVYTHSAPAIPDTHVTVIRVDPKQVDPSYLADYLRLGFGSVQIDRLYTGSTGMTELTPDQVNSIVVDLKDTVREQKRLSAQVRKAEKSYSKKREEADLLLANVKNIL
jgi:type I restriction enzyme M protein